MHFFKSTPGRSSKSLKTQEIILWCKLSLIDKGLIAANSYVIPFMTQEAYAGFGILSTLHDWTHILLLFYFIGEKNEHWDISFGLSKPRITDTSQLNNYTRDRLKKKKKNSVLKDFRGKMYPCLLAPPCTTDPCPFSYAGGYQSALKLPILCLTPALDCYLCYSTSSI